MSRGEAIVPVKLRIILFSNSHNFTYYAHRFYLWFSIDLVLMAFQTVNNILLIYLNMQNLYKRTNNNWLWVYILVKWAYPCMFYFWIKGFCSILCIFGKTWLYIVFHDFNLTYYSSIIVGSFSILIFPKLCRHIGLTPIDVWYMIIESIVMLKWCGRSRAST